MDKLVAAGGKAIMAPGSVGEAGGAEAMVLKAVADLGRLDLLVNNAGTPGTRHRIAPPDLDLITEELWTTLLEVNLKGVFRCAKAAAPALKAAGWRDRQHRLDRRAGPRRQQPGLRRHQGRRRSA